MATAGAAIASEMVVAEATAVAAAMRPNTVIGRTAAVAITDMATAVAITDMDAAAADMLKAGMVAADMAAAGMLKAGMAATSTDKR